MTRHRFQFRAALAVLVAVLAVALAMPGSAAAAHLREGPTSSGSTSSESAAGEGAATDSNPTVALEGQSESNPFPLDNYELDEQVQFGLRHLDNVFHLAIEMLIQGIWLGLIYLFNGVMVMLQWAFSLDLLQNSMSKLADALQVMRTNIDQPWGLAAVAAMALWGIWNGLVRKKSIDTLRGLLASVLAMAAVLVVIGNPVGTLGQFTSAANDASTEMLDSITSGSVSEPQQAVGSTEQSLFRAVILRPWCALQFGDVDYCLSEPQGLKQSVADTWLQAPPGSKWRTFLWNVTKSDSVADARGIGGEGPPGKDRDLGDMYNLGGHPEKVEMITGDGNSTMARLALVLLIAVGVVGAICLFTYLAVRLLLAALFVLVLAMFAPAMFLVAALGESGRASVVAWGTRLLGAVLTKVVFALFLAVIVAASNLVTDLNLGFFPTWLVFIAFWWGVLLKRKDLLALLSLDPKTASPSGIDFNGATGGGGLSQLFYARQLVGDVRRGARRISRRATAAPRAIGRRTRDAGGRAIEAGRLGQSDAARQLAREELENQGRGVLEERNSQKHRAEIARSAQVFAQEQTLRSRLADLDSKISRKRKKMTPQQLKGGGPASQSLDRAREKRAQVQQELLALRSSSRYDRARAAIGSKPREVSQRDVQAWMMDRRSELARGAAAPENLRAAGIDPEAFDRADEALKFKYLERSGALMHRQQLLFDRGGIGHPDDKREAMGFRERRKIRAELRRSGRINRFEDISRERARRHRQGFRNGRRNERRRRNVR